MLVHSLIHYILVYAKSISNAPCFHAHFSFLLKQWKVKRLSTSSLMVHFVILVHFLFLNMEKSKDFRQVHLQYFCHSTVDDGLIENHDIHWAWLWWGCASCSLCRAYWCCVRCSLHTMDCVNAWFCFSYDINTKQQTKYEIISHKINTTWPMMIIDITSDGY